MVKIDRLPSGSYRARIHLGSGKYKSITGKDKKSVQLRAAQFEAGIIKSSKKPLKLSVGDAINKYIEVKSNVLSPSTIRGYIIARRNMFSDLMPQEVANITSEDVQIAINNEAAYKSPKTIANECGLLSAALKMYAPDLRLDFKTPQRKKNEIVVPTEDEIRVMLRAVRGTDIEIPVILAACCGLRKSEILGLKWSDIDFNRNIISIHEAVVFDINNEEIAKGTKTFAGTRKIRAYPFVMDTISGAERSGERVVNLTGHMLYEHFQKMLKDQRLPHYRFHDLRHYLVSVMLSLNIPKNYIADYVGHETENMIDRVYGHIMQSKKTTVENQMQEYFESVTKSVTKSVTNDVEMP